MCDVYLVRIIVHLKVIEVFHYVNVCVIFHFNFIFSKLCVYTIGPNG